METLGGHYAWCSIGIGVAIIGFMGALMFLIDGLDSGDVLVGVILALLLAGVGAFGVIRVVREGWEISRITCDRQARNYSTDARWTKALGCYLRDDSGRYIPVDSYITTRIERSAP